VKRRRGLTIFAPAAAILALTSTAHADATGRQWTCQQTQTDTWPLWQPAEHYDAGYRPTWADCLAWRNGDPGPTYVWSYGQPSTPTTTEPEPASTTTNAPVQSSTTTTFETPAAQTTTTEPAPPATSPETTTTAEASTTTIPPATAPPTSSVPQNPTTSANPTTTQTTANEPQNQDSTQSTAETVPDAVTTSTETTLETPLSPETLPPAPVVPPTPKIALEGLTGDLAPGVTPAAARVVLVTTIGTFIVAPSPASRRKNNRG
jgi:hypothetical protein